MAKGRLVNQALNALRRFDRGNTVQPGMFSTLDEAISDAPFDVNTIDQWQNYLKPGRMVKREGAQFPLKKEELDWSLGRLTFDNPTQKFTKEQLRDLVSQQRQGFGVTMAHEPIGEFGPPTPHSPIPSSWSEDGRQFGAEVKVDAPRYGNEFAGDTDSRLFHASPGSTYEESITRMPGLDYRNHFDQDSLSWSRTSTHEVENPSYQPSSGQTRKHDKVRLVEEIQSDLHSDAADKFYTNQEGRSVREGTYHNLPEEDKAGFVPERIGHRSPGDLETASDMRKEVERLTEAGHEAYNDLDISDAEYGDIQTEIQRLQSMATRLESKVPNAPYKNPKEYAGLELRKQLLNAVDNDEQYLALVRGADQVERYSQGMNPQAVRGMEQMYDKVYLGELRKLAKRYGATVEDVDVPVSNSMDLRPEAMARGDYENFNDFIADHSATIYDLNSPRSYSSDINMVDSTLTELKDFGEQVMPTLYSHTGFPEHDINNLKKYLIEIGTLADEFDELKLRPGEPGWDFAQKAYQAKLDKPYDAAQQMLDNAYDDYVNAFDEINTTAAGVKTFPAIKLTDEVKDKIRELGVPQFAEGGVVKMADGGLSIFSNILRRPDAPELSEDEFEKVYANLSETEDERVLQEKMGTGKYWWDTVKHLPSAFLARMKKVDPETGEVRWLGNAPVPDLDMVANGMMTMEEWKAEKAAAEEYNEAGDDFKSTWVDDFRSMGAVPAMIGNLAGEYIPGIPGSLSNPEEGFQYPEWATDASQRVGAAERATQEDFGLEDPTGFFQHLTSAGGAMASQLPVPAGPLKGAVGAATKKIPQALRTIARPITAPAGAAMEFINPTIIPSVRNYGSGTLFGGALMTGMEPSGQDIRDIEGMQRKQKEFEYLAPRVAAVIEESWGDMSFEERVDAIRDETYSDVVLSSLTQEQYVELMTELEERGLLGDAE